MTPMTQSMTSLIQVTSEIHHRWQTIKNHRDARSRSLSRFRSRSSSRSISQSFFEKILHCHAVMKS